MAEPVYDLTITNGTLATHETSEAVNIAITDGRFAALGDVSADQGREHIDATGLTTTMSVTADDRAMPVSFGWHPWFRKPSSLDFFPTAMYRRDDEHVAVDDLVAVPDGPWDDCFLNHDPVTLRIGGQTIRVTSDREHWVVYDERPYATCVEPQTGPPDAFNIAIRRLEPGESLTAWYRIADA